MCVGVGVFCACLCVGLGYCVVRRKGTPSALKNPSDETWAPDETSSRRKSTPGDASMRRSIQDLVLSIDPNVKIEPEVEDVSRLLSYVIGAHSFLFFSFLFPPPLP